MLKGEKVDFVPRTPILMQFAAEYIGSDYACFASDFKSLVKSNEACAKYFEIDQLSCISDPYRETHGFGSRIEYMKDAPPHSTHPLSNCNDMSQLLEPDPLKSERMLDRINAIKLYKAKFGDEYSVLGWIEGPAAGAATLRDVSNVDHMVNLAEVRKALPKRITIAGNIDPVKGVLFGTPEFIREKINGDYQLVGNPYMVNAGCEIPSGTPYENLKALCDPISYWP